MKHRWLGLCQGVLVVEELLVVTSELNLEEGDGGGDGVHRGQLDQVVGGPPTWSSGDRVEMGLQGEKG
jgi:hypothetical protein